MKSQSVTKKPSLTIKTGLKAGDHCRDAFRYHLQDPYNNDKIRKFVDCCQRDNQCMR